MSVDRDKRMSIVVTGVGAIIGQGIIKSLRQGPEDVRIIGLDRNAHAFGGRYCDQFVQKPASEEGSAYLSFWRELLEQQSVDLLIPGIEQDLYFLDENRREFDKSHARIVLNSPELVRLGKDKWATIERLSAAGLDVIPSRISGSWDECLADLGPAPLLMKPRRGSGGKGIVFLHDEVDFDYWKKKSGKNFMVQRFVGRDDQEYTVSVFGFGNGSGTEPTILRRSLGPGGATWWAETIESCLPVEQATQSLNYELKPEGPTNYQFRLDGQTAFLLEINPRISSSTSLRAKLGVSEAWMCIEHYLKRRKIEPVKLRAGRAYRYIEDEVEKL